MLIGRAGELFLKLRDPLQARQTHQQVSTTAEGEAPVLFAKFLYTSLPPTSFGRTESWGLGGLHSCPGKLLQLQSDWTWSSAPQQGLASPGSFAARLWLCLLRRAACAPTVSSWEDSGQLPGSLGQLLFPACSQDLTSFVFFNFHCLKREKLIKIRLENLSSKYGNTHALQTRYQVPLHITYQARSLCIREPHLPSDRIHFSNEMFIE